MLHCDPGLCFKPEKLAEADPTTGVPYGHVFPAKGDMKEALDFGF